MFYLDIEDTMMLVDLQTLPQLRHMDPDKSHLIPAINRMPTYIDDTHREHSIKLKHLRSPFFEHPGSM